MTASSINSNSNPPSKGIKRAISFPKSLEMVVSEQQLSSKDSLLQSSNPRRRYMRRGSRCPSMLKTSFSLPRDLSSLLPEIELSSQHSDAPSIASSNTIFSDSSPPSPPKRSAVDLVSEALHLSSTFDGLDIETST